MSFSSDDNERMNNFMLKSVFMTNKELEAGSKWLSKPLVIAIALVIFFLSVIGTIGHA